MPRRGRHGLKINPGSIPSAWSSLTKPDGARLLYLPPYSPDFNPIEQLFAKLKAALRKAAERSVESLWNRIAILLNIFPPDECANYFRNAGYASL